MSLPTPPNTSHRDKENRSARFSTGSRVAWAEHDQYHTIPSGPQTPPAGSSIKASANKAPPAKSILKPSPLCDLPFGHEDKKETTPEPSDPLADLHYLETPVSRIVATDASLRDLIEAYSILTARIRACVPGETDADASWPLFQPLRQHRDALVDAWVRDLGRVFVEQVRITPDTEIPQPPTPPDEERVLLPSPLKSPRKKVGMSGEQVKNARDLCIVCHAVIKLLNVVFTLPAVYQVFTDAQLRFMLTHVLAIPLANELPTPNSRKTCALAIWLLQTQRLSTEVLEPAKDRIAYALRRGIEGELGKEGKKGSVHDGLKAIHEMSTWYPTLFVPAFTELLPSILSNLLAPTVVLRSQACHALSGFAFAVASIPSSAIHTRISDLVVDHLTTSPARTPIGGLSSPIKDPPLIRTLRTTLGNTGPSHPAQGPVWAWCVMASLIVLMGPAVYTDDRITRALTALVSLGMRHEKSSVRALGCLTWRCMVWAYFHDRLPRLNDGENVETMLYMTQKYKQRLNEVWKVVQSVVDLGAGVSMIGALLAGPSTDKRSLKRALDVLGEMSKKGGQTCKDALETAVSLVSPEPRAEWNARKLLPPGLFFNMPGLLTAEYTSLPYTVKPLFEECTQIEDIRPLTTDELALGWVFNSLMDVWREGLAALKLTWGCEIPSEILDVWHGLVKASIDAREGDEKGTVEFTTRLVDILRCLLEDSELDLSLDVEYEDQAPAGQVRFGHQIVQVPPHHRWNFGLRIYLVRELWNVMKGLVPQSALHLSGIQLITFLLGREQTLLDDIDTTDEIRYQWSSLCAEVLYECPLDELEKFWRGALRPRCSRKHQIAWIPEIRQAVWLTFAERWKECKATWDAAVILLGVPFREQSAWEITGDDVDAWDALLRGAISKAFDYGVDSVSVIDQVAARICSTKSLTFTSATRVADLLLSHLDFNEAREIPMDVLGLTNDSLLAAYPPESDDKVTALWLIRSLTRIIDACPAELALNLFELVQEGLSVWIADEFEAFSAEEYALDILPVYQTVLLGVESLPMSADTVETLATMLESGLSGRQDKPAAALQAFQDFWQASCADIREPVGGWCEKIQNCMRVLPGKEIPDDVSESNDALFAEDARDVELEESPVATPAAAISALAPVISLSSALFIRAPVSPSAVITPPCTPPTRICLLPSTPPRPHKPSPQSQIIAIHDEPVRTPLTPNRSPHTPKRGHASSARRRSTDNKENISPLLMSATVAERIANQSSVAAGSTVLGKRRAPEDVPEKEAKRGRLDLGDAAPLAPGAQPADAPEDGAGRPARPRVSFGDTTSHAHKQTLPKTPHPSRTANDDEDEDPFGTPSGSESSSSDREESTPRATVSVSRPRKRKGVYLEAVEVPMFRDVLRRERDAHMKSLLLERVTTLSSEAGSSSPAVTPTRRTLRRTRSATKMLGEEAFESLEYSETPTPSKRRKSRVAELLQEARATPSLPSSPLRAVRETQIAGSDDSIMMVTPRKSLPVELSSDDDPQPGNVNPRGVVSPALRRVRSSETDLPSSDDSNMTASPSRERVKRRIARMPSSFLNPSPSKLRSRLSGGSSWFKSED